MRLIILLLLLTNLVYGQQEYQKELLRLHGVKAIDFYNFSIEDNQVQADSVLRVQEKFNPKGLVTNTYIYESSELKNHYEKKYLNDTLLVEMNTYSGLNETPSSVAKFDYVKGVQISETHFTENEKTIEVHFKYNKEKQLVKRIAKYKDKKKVVTEYRYNLRNQLVARKDKKKGAVKFYYDREGRPIAMYQVKRNKSAERLLGEKKYEGTTDRLISKSYLFYGSTKIIGEGGIKELQKNDSMLVEYFYLENGLIDYVKQYHNKQLDAVKKYIYYYQ